MPISSNVEIITTTYPGLDTVQLDTNALAHIQEKHPEVLEQGVGDIVSTVSNPDQVYEGNQPTTNIFVKRSVYRDKQMNLRVATKQLTDTAARVTTANYTNADRTKTQLIWDSTHGNS
ncbi:MAG: hypothetical protein OXE84_06130 [Rhodobacteraceae bacterium]|nr:hypothetical protein [Paracoccaceae bacterium]MCY4196637.1 hypothetical protein [Paracoccaceae bacterium]MCY4326348.1 hypothetical protein [Paracoccaceae bacterium]